MYARMSDDMIAHSIVVNCTFDTFFELAVLFFRCSLTSSSGLKETGSYIIITNYYYYYSFIIPLHCLKLATSQSDLSNSNSVLSMPPVLEATMYDTGFLVTPTSKSRTVLTNSLSLLTSIAQIHKLLEIRLIGL